MRKLVPFLVLIACGEAPTAPVAGPAPSAGPEVSPSPARPPLPPTDPEPAALDGKPFTVRCERSDPLEAEGIHRLFATKDAVATESRVPCESGVADCRGGAPRFAERCDDVVVHHSLANGRPNHGAHASVVGDALFFRTYTPMDWDTWYLARGRDLTRLDMRGPLPGPDRSALLVRSDRVSLLRDGVETPLVHGADPYVDAWSFPGAFQVIAGPPSARQLHRIQRDLSAVVTPPAHAVWPGSTGMHQWTCLERSDHAELVHFEATIDYARRFPGATCRGLNLRAMGDAVLVIDGGRALRVSHQRPDQLIAERAVSDADVHPLGEGWALWLRDAAGVEARLVTVTGERVEERARGLPASAEVVVDAEHLVVHWPGPERDTLTVARHVGDRLERHTLVPEGVGSVFGIVWSQFSADGTWWFSTRRRDSGGVTLYALTDGGVRRIAQEVMGSALTRTGDVELLSVIGPGGGSLFRVGDEATLTPLRSLDSAHEQLLRGRPDVLELELGGERSIHRLRPDGSLDKVWAGFTQAEEWQRRDVLWLAADARRSLVELDGDRAHEILADQDEVWAFDGPLDSDTREPISWGYGGRRRVGADTELTLCNWQHRCLRRLVIGGDVVGQPLLTDGPMAAAIVRHADGTQRLWRAMLD